MMVLIRLACLPFNFYFYPEKLITPTISMFFWRIVPMYYAPKEHNTPHIHLYYQDVSATVDMGTCEILEGNIPSKQHRLVTAWIEIYSEEF
ncbi:MAG: DUF4160 domain-containing protein [Flavobacterium sp.]|nr:DUF4160 domain-containing protein [Flavobacterium sp.]